MNNKVKIIILFIFVSLAFLPKSIFSQDDVNNMHKYWYYRERLKHFVIPGCNYGESNMAGIANRQMIKDEKGSGQLDFSQNGVYFGYYLGILATEYKLLVQNNQINAATRTEAEVVSALDQYIDYMDKSEHNWKCNGTTLDDLYDGFFTRNCVPSGFLSISDINYGSTLTTPSLYHVDLLNYDVDKSNIFQNNSFVGLVPGHPGYYDPTKSNNNIAGYLNTSLCNSNSSDDDLQSVTMNQDEITGIIMGLALIYQCMGASTQIVDNSGKNCQATSRDIALLMIDKVCQGKHWRIEDPCGKKVWDDQYYAYGWARVARDFFGGPPIVATYFDNIGDEEYYEIIWWGVREFNATDFWIPQSVLCTNWFLLVGPYWCPFSDDMHISQPTYNQTMSSILAAIGDSWDFMGDNRTYQGLVYSNTGKQSQSFYTLLYKTLHPSKSLQSDEVELMREQLLTAPGEGPYYYGPGLHPPSDGYTGGWSCSYKWRQEVNNQVDGMQDFEGNYSGCDYMLAYNMWLLAGYGDYANVKPLYHPYENILVSHFIPYVEAPTEWEEKGNYNKPLQYKVYSSINSDMTIYKSTKYFENGTPILDPLILEGYINLYGQASFIAKDEIKLLPGFFVEKGAKFNAKTEPEHFFWNAFECKNSGCDRSQGMLNTEQFITDPCYNPPSIPIIIHDNFNQKKIITVQNELSLQIFPNPTYDKINILYNDNIEEHLVQIISMNQKVIYKNAFYTNSSIIDLSSYPDGVYSIQIISNESTITRKVVKI